MPELPEVEIVRQSLLKNIKGKKINKVLIRNRNLRFKLKPSFEKKLKNKIIAKIKKIYDPEIPVNIYDLGLIYKIEVKNNNTVDVDMTLTSPNCPVAESLPKQVKDNILEMDEISQVNLNLVWDPPWDKDKMSEAAKLELNL